MKVFIASDHAGFELKKKLVEYLGGYELEVVDLGPEKFDEADDYPDFIIPLAKKVAEDPENHFGIALGGSGQGEAMVANRFPGVRAAVYYGMDLAIVRLCREHNDANVLSLGARFLMEEEAEFAVKIFLETKFSGEERHKRRILKLERIT